MNKEQSSYPSEARETLSRWLETGKHPGAIAGYGTSAETITRILREWQIPPNTPKKEMYYQKDIVRRGLHLYFFYPYLTTLISVQPTLAHRYQELIQSGIISSLDLDETRITHDLRTSAVENALDDGFMRLTGIAAESPEILYIGLNIAHDQTVNYLETLHRENIWQIAYDDILDDADKKLANNIINTVGAKKLRSLYPSLYTFRGVIVHYGRSILTSGTAAPGIEAGYELLLTTQKPLEVSTILGIEPLSSTDHSFLIDTIK